HAAAAALVGHRYGVAGLRTVIADQDAPLARRYFAFLALAELHPPRAWPVFARYLIPDAHHAFQGAAVEAARFYPVDDPAAPSAQKVTRVITQAEAAFEESRTTLTPVVVI